MYGKKVFIQTYGCTSNKADSQTMGGLLEQAGYTLTEKEKDANYIIVNSCAVKSATEEKIIHRLKNLSGSNKKIIVAGCLTKVNADRIKKAVPNFAGMLDPYSIHEIVNVVREIENGNEGIVKFSKQPMDKPSLPRKSFSQVIDIVKLSDGCLSNCVFCATKLARGDLKSYRPNSIREAVKNGLLQGHKEFHLTSEDSSAYGRDIGTNLSDLLQSVCKIDGDFWIRIGMMNPLHFKKVEIKDLIEAFKDEKVFKFLHLCVQSGSNNVLKVMRRGYDVEDFVYYIKEFKKEIPELTLSTDIIVGHPGEEDEDFKETVKLIEEVRPDIVNISKFGARPGTLAAKMKQIDSKIVNERSKYLHDLTKEIELRNNKKWLGWEGRIIVDEKGLKEGTWMGRNYAYKQIVLNSDEMLLGKFVDVKINQVKSNYIIGSLNGENILE